MLANAIKKRLNKEEGQKGFTLIELLAVIVILGIIAVIAIPLIGNIISDAKKDSDVASARQIYDAARLYIAGESDGKFNRDASFQITIAEMQAKGYLDTALSLPSSKDSITGGAVLFTKDGQLSSVQIAPQPLGSKAETKVPTNADGTATTAGGSFTASQVLKSVAATPAP
ncbi:type II secretion system protein [Paenibacillus tepidiphilus]|uniref:type II secretion system protein n=1 Tax=Paenibacillus tepidiphilus TaxID=2608683 RepID=UPI001EEF9B93|nr:type II secretion system protein [Paenibacillus tepidiphilus]